MSAAKARSSPLSSTPTPRRAGGTPTNAWNAPRASSPWSRPRARIPREDGGGITNNTTTPALGNRTLNSGPTKTARRHIFNASLVLALPSLENKSGFVRNVFGDWEVAGIVAAASGQAISVFTTGGLNGLNGGPAGTGLSDYNPPNRVPGVSCKPTSGPKEQILNPAAFTLNGFKLGTVGDAGPGICEGPGLQQVDPSLYKNVKISKSVKAQLRFEVFNILNHVNFLSNQLNINYNPSSVTYDTGNAATATRITNATVPNTFGQSTATRDARQAKFGIKLIF